MQIDNARFLRPRLLAANQELYGEYDRLAAEAEFRVNIALPLAVFAYILAIDFGWWLKVVAVLISCGLLVAGLSRLAQAKNVMQQAVLNRIFAHPVVEALERLDFAIKVDESRSAAARRKAAG